jgi:hypothetical protein
MSEIGQVAGRRGASPAGTNPQMPGEPGVLQALQASVQALLQQTPSTQKPLAQSPGQPQASPFISCIAPVHATTGVSTDASPFGASERLPQPINPNETTRIAAATRPRRFGMLRR